MRSLPLGGNWVEIMKVLELRADSARWDVIAAETRHRKQGVMDVGKWFQTLTWEEIRTYPDNIQRIRRDYMDIKMDERQAQVAETTEVAVTPGSGTLFHIKVPNRVIWIESIEVHPSEAGVPFEFLVWDREQPAGYWQNDVDLVLKEESRGVRVIWMPARPLRYEDRSKSEQLHCGICLGKRPIRLDVPQEEWETLSQRPISFRVTLRYKSSI